MDNSLLQELGSKAKISFSKFLQLGIGGTVFSFFLLFLLDFLHPNFCSESPNIYFWKCLHSLWVHVVFLIIFPSFYLIFAIFYAQKFILYLIVEVIINKAKYQSVQWVLVHIPSQLHYTLQKISKKLGNHPFNLENSIENLVNIPYKKISQIFMPDLLGFYIIIFVEILTFIYVWVKL